MEISLIKGHFTTAESIPSNAKKFVLEERQNSQEVVEKMEEEGGKKTSLFDIPVFIPVYNPITDMTEGPYTFLVRLYSGDLQISSGILTTFLGQGKLYDANGDGILNVLDIVLTMKFFTNEISPTPEQLARIDLNQNKVVDLLDVISIFRKVLSANQSPTPSPSPNIAYFVFSDTYGDEFVFQLTKPEKIEFARKILRGEETEKVHIMGTYIRNTATYNTEWNYSLVPESIDFFQNTIELCDASIHWLSNPENSLPNNFWCPWSSNLVREIQQ
jgi:hypothetical protein